MLCKVRSCPESESVEASILDLSRLLRNSSLLARNGEESSVVVTSRSTLVVMVEVVVVVASGMQTMSCRTECILPMKSCAAF